MRTLSESRCSGAAAAAAVGDDSKLIALPASKAGKRVKLVNSRGTYLGVLRSALVSLPTLESMSRDELEEHHAAFQRAFYSYERAHNLLVRHSSRYYARSLLAPAEIQHREETAIALSHDNDIFARLAELPAAASARSPRPTTEADAFDSTAHVSTADELECTDYSPLRPAPPVCVLPDTPASLGSVPALDSSRPQRRRRSTPLDRSLARHTRVMEVDVGPVCPATEDDCIDISDIVSMPPPAVMPPVPKPRSVSSREGAGSPTRTSPLATLSLAVAHSTAERRLSHAGSDPGSQPPPIAMPRRADSLKGVPVRAARRPLAEPSLAPATATHTDVPLAHAGAPALVPAPVSFTGSTARASRARAPEIAAPVILTDSTARAEPTAAFVPFTGDTVLARHSTAVETGAAAPALHSGNLKNRVRAETVRSQDSDEISLGESASGRHSTHSRASRQSRASVISQRSAAKIDLSLLRLKQQQLAKRHEQEARIAQLRREQEQQELEDELALAAEREALLEQALLEEGIDVTFAQTQLVVGRKDDYSLPAPLPSSPRRLLSSEVCRPRTTTNSELSAPCRTAVEPPTANPQRRRPQSSETRSPMLELAPLDAGSSSPRGAQPGLPYTAAQRVTAEESTRHCARVAAATRALGTLDLRHAENSTSRRVEQPSEWRGVMTHAQALMPYQQKIGIAQAPRPPGKQRPSPYQRPAHRREDTQHLPAHLQPPAPSLSSAGPQHLSQLDPYAAPFINTRAASAEPGLQHSQPSAGSMDTAQIVEQAVGAARQPVARRPVSPPPYSLAGTTAPKTSTQPDLHAEQSFHCSHQGERAPAKLGAGEDHFNLRPDRSSSGCSHHSGRSAVGPQSTEEWQALFTSATTAAYKAAADSLPRQRTLHIKLPDKYDGSPLTYHSFVNAFERIVHKETDDLGERLDHLVAYTKGDARRVVEPYAAAAPNYWGARDALKQRFGRPLLVAQAFTKGLREGPRLTPNDGPQLRALYQDMEAATQALRSLSLRDRIDNEYILDAIHDRLPTFLQREWAKRAARLEDEDRPVDFATMTDFIKEQSNIANSRYTARIATTTKSTRSTTKIFTTDTAPAIEPAVLSTHSKAPDQPRAPCPACQRTECRKLQSCQAFRDLEPARKRDAVFKKQVCFNCFNYGHQVRECRHKSACTVKDCDLKRKHHTLLHGVPISRPANGRPPAVNHAAARPAASPPDTDSE